ncbi:MAG: flagellar biosynthesis protein [Lachnospiraceae bacterium]|nr:flagellar biosynthesis protein [Lachnospiraceae bacterium]
MRSLSNLYKQRYVFSDDFSKRVINSNVKVAERLEELQREERMKAQIPDPQGAADGFMLGLQAEEVDAVPKEPVISPEEIRRMAQEEADDLLNDARKQADMILADADSEAQAIREEARNAGFEEGHQEGAAKADAELTELRGQMEEEQRQLKESYRKKIDELEPYLVDIVSDVFEKVFHVQFGDKKDILVYLIERVILNAEGTKEFQVRVSRADYEFVESQKDAISAQVGASIGIEIMADASLQEHQCMIETDSGVFECGLDIQLENLLKTLKSLSL